MQSRTIALELVRRTEQSGCFGRFVKCFFARTDAEFDVSITVYKKIAQPIVSDSSEFFYSRNVRSRFKISTAI